MVLRVIIHYKPPFSKGSKARANNNDSNDRQLRAFAAYDWSILRLINSARKPFECSRLQGFQGSRNSRCQETKALKIRLALA